MSALQVKVHYIGYETTDDAWVSVEMLKWLPKEKTAVAPKHFHDKTEMESWTSVNGDRAVATSEVLHQLKLLAMLKPPFICFKGR